MAGVRMPADMSGDFFELRSAIDRCATEAGARRWSVALRRLRDGAGLMIGPDLPFHAASTVKIFVMIELFRAAGRGELSLDDRVRLHDTFTSVVDGGAYRLRPEDDAEPTLYRRIGRSATLMELARLMITASSNLATNVLLEIVAPERVTAGAAGDGATGTSIVRGMQDLLAFESGVNNRTTSRDLMLALEAIALGQAVSAPASAAMLEILLAQRINDGIPAGLPPDVRVAHKTGTIGGICHDAGIVFPPEPRSSYILVVLTEGIADRSRGRGAIAAIASAAHAALA